MKAYSVDLRQKVIDAYNQGEGSQRQLAKRFRVSLTFIENLLKRYRTDGTVEPRNGDLTKLNKLEETNFLLWGLSGKRLNKLIPCLTNRYSKRQILG